MHFRCFLRLCRVSDICISLSLHRSSATHCHLTSNLPSTSSNIPFLQSFPNTVIWLYCAFVDFVVVLATLEMFLINTDIDNPANVTSVQFSWDEYKNTGSVVAYLWCDCTAIHRVAVSDLHAFSIDVVRDYLCRCCCCCCCCRRWWWETWRCWWRRRCWSNARWLTVRHVRLHKPQPHTRQSHTQLSTVNVK